MAHPKSNTFSIERTVAQTRDAALVKAGHSPQLLAIKPGTRHHGNRRAAATRGHMKHKGRAFDF